MKSVHSIRYLFFLGSIAGCIVPPGALFHTSIATLTKCPTGSLPSEVVSEHTVLERTGRDTSDCGSGYMLHEIGMPPEKGVIANGYFEINKVGNTCRLVLRSPQICNKALDNCEGFDEFKERENRLLTIMAKGLSAGILNVDTQRIEPAIQKTQIGCAVPVPPKIPRQAGTGI